MSGQAVTAIVPVWNRCELLGPALCGLREQTHAPAEVLVVDDGSEDDSASMAERMGARVIRLGSHGGFARAVNRGIRECRTPLVAVVNNDVELAPDWLARLVAALEADKLWFATGRILQAADRARIDATFDALCRGGTSWRVGHGCLDGPEFAKPREIRFAPFTAALFRTALFKRVGFLDERFESYLEDVDFGLRCALSGCVGAYVPQALAWHAGSATMGRWHPETVRRIARNQVFLIAKYYNRASRLRNWWSIVVAQFLWGLIALRYGRIRPWFKGKTEGLQAFDELRLPSAHLDCAALDKILRESENDIRAVQQNSAPDLYWRLYFLLTASGRK